MRAFAGPHCPRLESQVCAPGRGHGTSGPGLCRATLDELGLEAKAGGTLGMTPWDRRWGTEPSLRARAGRYAEPLRLSPELAIRTETLQALLLGSEAPMASAGPRASDRPWFGPRSLGWNLERVGSTLCTLFPYPLRGKLVSPCRSQKMSCASPGPSYPPRSSVWGDQGESILAETCTGHLVAFLLRSHSCCP